MYYNYQSLSGDNIVSKCYSSKNAFSFLGVENGEEIINWDNYLYQVAKVINCKSMLFISEYEIIADYLNKLGFSATALPQPYMWNKNYFNYINANTIIIVAKITDNNRSRIEELAKKLYNKKYIVKVLDLKRYVKERRKIYAKISIEERNEIINNLLYRLLPYDGKRMYDVMPDCFNIDEKNNIKINYNELAEHIFKKYNFRNVLDNYNQRRMYMFKKGVYEIVSNDILNSLIKDEILLYYDKVLPFDISTTQKLMNYHKIEHQNELNINPYQYINFNNGILDLTTMQMIDNPKKVFSTIQIPCNYEVNDIETPVFDKFIKTIANNDSEVFNFILQFIGVAISNIPGYMMKKVLLLVGPGNTGKSQLFKLIQYLIGDKNSAVFSFSQLDSRFETSIIFGKRFVGDADLSFEKSYGISSFKSITGGDLIKGEYKGKNAFTFKYNGVIMLCSNQYPDFAGDRGDWVFERFVPIECNNVIPLCERDPLILDKMKKEANGIVKKAIKSLIFVLKNNKSFNIPAICTEYMKNFKLSGNPVAVFFNDFLEYDSTAKYATKEMHNTFNKWYHDNYNLRMSANKFKKSLIEYLNCSEKDILTKYNGNYYYRLKLK